MPRTETQIIDCMAKSLGIHSLWSTGVFSSFGAIISGTINALLFVAYEATEERYTLPIAEK
jgi:hypothetical protein